MTESEWLASTDPTAMLSWMQGEDLRGHRLYPASPRKLRLFACACCRQVWDGADCPGCHGSNMRWCGDIRVAGPERFQSPCPDCHGTGRVGGLTDPRSRRAVEVAERFADGKATEDEFRYHRHEAYSAWLSAGPAASAEADRVFPSWVVMTEDPARDFRPNGDLWHILVRNGCSFATQAALLRDIFGNPFKPLVIRGLGRCPNCHQLPCACQNHWERGVGADWLSWNDGAVLRIAQAIYAERRWGDMPILADALEESGCTDKAILAHCRGLGPHARGCWVIDLLL